jgi:hypothetical protein
MKRFLSFNYFYLFLAIVAAAAVPAMADDNPDSTEGDVRVIYPSDPANPTPKPVKGAKVQAPAAPADAAPGPKSMEGGYANIGAGSVSMSDANKTAGGASVAVGYRRQTGGSIQGELIGEQNDYFTLRLRNDRAGFYAFGDPANPSDKVLIGVGAAVDATFGAGTKTGSFLGALTPTVYYRLTQPDLEAGVGAGFAAGGLYTARLRTADGQNIAGGGVGPQLEVYLNHKWIKLHGSAMYLPNFAPATDSATRHIFNYNATAEVPFYTKDNVNIALFADVSHTIAVSDAYGKTTDGKVVPSNQTDSTVTNYTGGSTGDFRGSGGLRVTW